MVNKGSFFQRLKERWGSSSRVRIDNRAETRTAPPPAPPAPGAQNGGATAPRPATAPAPARPPAATATAQAERIPADRQVAMGAPAEFKSTRKLSDREEAMVALGSHFQELTTLLRGSQARTDDQLGKLVNATDALGNLPAIGQQQLDTLRALAVHMEKQTAFGEQMATTVNRLPAMMENVEKALERAVATDERTAATVREFHATMDRIHESMGRMVEQGGQHVEAARKIAERRDDALLDIAQGIESTQKQALEDLKTTTDQSLQTLRRTHEDQSNRLQRVVEEHASWNRAVMIGVGVVVLGIAALIALQLLQ
jgi:hypothetical protein